MSENNEKYWQKFYRTKSINSLDFPSQFSIFTLSKKGKENDLFEFGCGNGRDAAFMYKFYKRTFAFDMSETAIKLNKKKYKNFKSLKFKICDIRDYFNVKKYRKFKKCIYARFFLHSLNYKEISKFIYLATRLLNKNEKIFVEYRTHLDKNKKKFFKNHFRNFLNPKKIIKMFNKEKLIKIYSINGYGLAVFNDEDPHVARQIFIKK